MYLLDTHALIWFLFDADKLPKETRRLVEDAESVSVSLCSLWEIAIKQNIGKLDIDISIEDLARICAEQNIDILNIAYRHLDAIKQMPFIHRDPFDRLLVAQAQCEELTIVTKDAVIAEYDVQTVWN